MISSQHVTAFRECNTLHIFLNETYDIVYLVLHNLHIAVQF